MKIRRVGTLLILFAGGILHAGVWHWYGACGHYWHQTCVVGTCGSQNQYNLVANNWGQVVCNGTPPFPGPADTVVLQPGDSVILESDVELQRLIIQEGATLVWRGNLTVHEVVENHGHLVYAEGYYNRTFSGTLHNYGTFTQTTGTLILDSASTLINHPGATLNLQQGTLRTNDSSSTLQNSGLLLKSSTSNFYLESPLRLQQAPPGSLLVHEGTLNMDGSLSGPVHVDAGAALHLRGTYLSNTTRISGPGTLFLEGNLVSTADSLTLTTSIDSIRWTSNFSLGPGSQWLNYGHLVYAEGTYSRTFSGTLHNYGTFTQATGTLTLDSASTLINHPGATLELRLGSLYARDSSGTLQNSGLLLKSSTNTFYLHSPLRLQQAPPGSLLVHEGTLYLYGSLSGPVYVDAGAALHLRGAHLSDTTRIAGPGTLFLEGDLVSTADSITLTTSIDSTRWTSNLSLGSGSQWLNYGRLFFTERYYNRTFSGTFHNYGTFTQTTGTLTLDSASTLINHPGATLELRLGSLYAQDSSGTLQNSGLLLKSSTNTFYLHSPLRLQQAPPGSLLVQEGTLYIYGSLSGPVYVDAGAALHLRGAHLSDTTRIAGPGTLFLEGDLVSTSDSLTFITSIDSIRWTSSFSLGPGSQWLNYGHLVYAEIWTYLRTFSGTLHNYGIFTQPTGNLTLDSASTFINHPGATFELRYGNLYTRDSSSTLQNSGLLLKSSTNTFTLWSPLRLQQAPPGSLLVHEGTLYLYGSLNGPVYVDAGAALHLRGAHLSDTTRIAGPGTLFLEGDLVSTSDSITLTTSIDSTRWTCNLSLGSGSQWLNYGHLVYAENYFYRTFSGTLHNYGTLTQTTGNLTLDSASTLINHPGATLNLRSGTLRGPQDGFADLVNQGTVYKTFTYTSYLHRLHISQEGSWFVQEGTLDFGTSTTFSQPQGRTVVTSLIQGSQPLSLLHGSLQGSGTLRAPVLLTGDTLSPGDSSGHTAALTFQHSLVLEPTAVYCVEIAGTEFSDTVQAYDRLVVNASSGDSVTLHTPTLQVVLLPGYTPCATPDSFAILTWNSSTSFSGSFGTLQLVNAAPSVNAWLAVHGRALYLYLMDTEALLGDVNNDGEVNALDVDDLANYLYFHGPPVPGCADLNRDSRIDDEDLVALTRLLWPRGTAK